MVRERAKELIDKVLHDLDRVKCEVCQSKFSNFDSLSRHMRKFHGPLDKKINKEYKCDVCQKRFPGPAHLKTY